VLFIAIIDLAIWYLVRSDPLPVQGEARQIRHLARGPPWTTTM
jgi:hypothetical protein